jgi:thioredoxin-like negative regulator of GroEL
MVESITTTSQLQSVLANAGERIVCVKFTAKWCGPCKKIQPVVEDLARRYAQQFMVFTSDVDVATELVAHFNIKSMPTFIFFRKNKIVYTLKGADSKLLQDAFEIMVGMMK